MRRVVVIEAAVRIAGMLAICLALAAVDWRLGLGSLGLFLIAATIDIPRRAT